MERLRYSDRTLLAEQGTLGALSYDEVPPRLQEGIASIYRRAAQRPRVGRAFEEQFCSALERHFGGRFYGIGTSPSNGQRAVDFIQRPELPIADFLDVVEILIEQATQVWTIHRHDGEDELQADAYAEEHTNEAFVRHRFGFRMSNGNAHRVGSPALDEALVGPALLATARPGWEQADRSYRDALYHRRGGSDERGAAITDAHAALEAAMKAAGLKGDTLAALAKDLRNSGKVLSQLEGVPEMLDKLLKRSQAIRDSQSDAHGRAPGTEIVGAEVVDLAIHWTGSFIVYLADAAAAD
jgi:hypothetical protein